MALVFSGVHIVTILLSRAQAACPECAPDDASSLIQLGTHLKPKEWQVAMTHTPPFQVMAQQVQPVNMLSMTEEQVQTSFNTGVSRAASARDNQLQAIVEQRQHELAPREQPANGHIVGEEEANGHIQLFDANGQIVVEEEADAPAQPGKYQWRPRLDGDQNTDAAVVASLDLCPPYQKDCDNEDTPNAALGDDCKLPVYDFHGARYCVTDDDNKKWGWCAESVDGPAPQPPVDLAAESSVAETFNTHLGAVADAAADAAADADAASGLNAAASDEEETVRQGAESNARFVNMANTVRDQTIKEGEDETDRMKLMTTQRRDKEFDDSTSEIDRMKAAATELRDSEFDASTKEILREKATATGLRDNELEAAVAGVKREREMATKLRDSDFLTSQSEVVREQQKANELRDADYARSTSKVNGERNAANGERDKELTESRDESRRERTAATKYRDNQIAEATKERLRERAVANNERNRQLKASKVEILRAAAQATKERDEAQERATRIRDCYAYGGAYCEQKELERQLADTEDA